MSRHRHLNTPDFDIYDGQSPTCSWAAAGCVLTLRNRVNTSIEPRNSQLPLVRSNDHCCTRWGSKFQRHGALWYAMSIESFGCMRALQMTTDACESNSLLDKGMADMVDEHCTRDVSRRLWYDVRILAAFVLLSQLVFERQISHSNKHAV